MANFWDLLGAGIQKPQSMLSGSTLGGLRWLGLADPNSKYESGATNPISGLWAGTKDSIKPHDIVNEMAGDPTPGLLQKIIGTTSDVIYDPLLALGGAAKVGELGEGAAKVADVLGGAKLGKYIENPSTLQKIAAGAARAGARTYEGTLASENNDPIKGFMLGQLGAGAGKGIGKVGDYVGKYAPEGSKLAEYMQGRAAAKALGTGSPAEEAAFLGDPTIKGADEATAAKAAATRRLAEATTPRQAAEAAVATLPPEATPFGIPASVKTGPGTYGELPGPMTINPQQQGLQQTVPWAPSTEPDPFGEALFSRQGQEGAQLFDPRALSPGQMAPPSGGGPSQLEFPGTLGGTVGAPTPFSEPSFGPQSELSQAAQRRVMPNKRYIPGQPTGPVGNQGQMLGPELGGGPVGNAGPPEISAGNVAQDFRPANAGQPWQGAMPGPMSDVPLGPTQQNPAIPPWLQQQAPQSGSAFQSPLSQGASGSDIVKAIQEALQQGVPMSDVYRTIMRQQFPGRF
jgi:hypothetical protein